MPHHHGMWDWDYGDLPPKAKEAAKELGFTADIWDDDEHVPYETEKICDVPNLQKSAALYLGLDPIDTKCDMYWEEADEKTKKYATILGWDQHRWDDDWELHDLDIEHKYWAELSDEEKEAAEYFGYSQSLWDEVEDEAGLPNWGQGEAEAPEEEEKKEDEPEIIDEEVLDGDEESDEVEDVPDEEAADAADDKPKKKVMFKKSKAYGSQAGDAFSLGNHKHIQKLTIHSDRHICHGIAITVNGAEKMAGTADGDKHEFELGDDEFITHVKVRSRRYIQSMTFRTNQGRTLGPVGGKGWRFGKDKPGEEVSIPAPFKRQLCGFSGRAGRNLDNICMHWGPLPSSS